VSQRDGCVLVVFPRSDLRASHLTAHPRTTNSHESKSRKQTGVLFHFSTRLRREYPPRGKKHNENHCERQTSGSRGDRVSLSPSSTNFFRSFILSGSGAPGKRYEDFGLHQTGSPAGCSA